MILKLDNNGGGIRDLLILLYDNPAGSRFEQAELAALDLLAGAFSQREQILPLGSIHDD